MNGRTLGVALAVAMSSGCSQDRSHASEPAPLLDPSCGPLVVTWDYPEAVPNLGHGLAAELPDDRDVVTVFAGSAPECGEWLWHGATAPVGQLASITAAITEPAASEMLALAVGAEPPVSESVDGLRLGRHEQGAASMLSICIPRSEVEITSGAMFGRKITIAGEVAGRLCSRRH